MRQLFEYHPVVGYRFIPDLKARITHESGGYLLKANEAGFRSDRPFSVALARGRQRVLFFGDSFTAGYGVANPERYTDRIEHLLPGVETYNFGLSSTGTESRFAELASELRCTLHDPLPDLLSYERTTRRAFRWESDIHFTPAGHQAVAESLAPVLRRLLAAAN